MAGNFKMVATTLFGLEDILAKELLRLGAQKIQKQVRSVSFYGDYGFMYKANLALHTAIRVLKSLKTFKVYNETDLYNSIKSIEWDKYLDVDNTFAINAVVNSDDFTTNSHYIALKSKDAVADYFREKYNKRPSVDLDHPHLKLNVHIHKNTCNVYLDSSGMSLHKRGYRSATNIAPINEVLAAGLLLLAGYDGTTHLIDPMCGSGTILIEAAMIANNIPPNINRKEFGFENWKDFDEPLYDKIYEALLKRVRSNSLQIIGIDKAPSAIMKAADNIKNANLEEFIKIEKGDFFTSEKEVKGPALLVFNPPYGERLAIDAEGFYKKIGDTLKQSYKNTKAWLITSDLEALKHVGLRTSRRIPMKNGNLECRYVNYEIYEGSKKASKNS
ncbi:MAG: class I SAM-dependent RNA methyltransferase [Flavobacteriaceae bacterium]|nr:class I SAM-dependent RNA methyltransferase [Flavobacteriaceae bacterium]